MKLATSVRRVVKLWHGGQQLAAGSGEPDPLGAGMDQAAMDQGEGDGPTNRPARHYRTAGAGKLLQRGQLRRGQLLHGSTGRLDRRSLEPRLRGAPGTQGARLDLGPGPAPPWDRPTWGRGRAQEHDGSLVDGHLTRPPTSCRWSAGVPLAPASRGRMRRGAAMSTARELMVRPLALVARLAAIGGSFTPLLHAAEGRILDAYALICKLVLGVMPLRTMRCQLTP
jgi:hypothetical protein